MKFTKNLKLAKQQLEAPSM